MPTLLTYARIADALRFKMSSSEVYFQQKYRHVRDAVIGKFLDLLKDEIDNLQSEDKNRNWLQKAWVAWDNEWQEMPPGLRDMILDDFLIDLDRQQCFYTIVSTILEKVRHFSEGSEVLVREIKKIKELLE